MNNQISEQLIVTVFNWLGRENVVWFKHVKIDTKWITVIERCIKML